MLHKKYKEKNRILGRKRREKIKKDPELHEKFLEKIRIYRKKQYSKNREVILRRLRDWYNNRMKPETKEKIRQWKRKWERKQRATNPAFKIKYNHKEKLYFFSLIVFYYKVLYFCPQNLKKITYV